MMTFKEFYLQSSKAAKLLPELQGASRPTRREDEILDRIAKLKAAKDRSGLRS